MTLPDGVILLQPGENRRPGRVLLKASGADTHGAYALRENTIPPGFLVSPHRHNDVDEAWFVIHGTMSFLVEHEAVDVAAGGFVFVPHGVVHAFANRSNAPAHYLVLFSPPGFENMFEETLALRASGESTAERRAEIRARYNTEEVQVPPNTWPPD